MPALVAFMVLAGVSVSLAARSDRAAVPEPIVSSAVSPPGRSGHHGDEGPGGNGEPSPSADPPTDVTAACSDSLAVGDAALEREHGLDRAIEVIVANCEKSPAARGLVNALQHLRANQERQNANVHGGQQNENASASGSTGTPPGHTEGGNAPGGNGQGAEHANEHAAASARP